MIDINLLFWLELSVLAVLVGVGLWRIYGTQQSETINAQAPAAHDMRQNGQQLSLETAPR